MNSGVVTFVSLGPGDPALRTERAAQRIAAADRVVRDSDVKMLIELAQQGLHVVRVVAGDALESPSVIAEALAVVGAGVTIEVVPGVGAQGTAAAFAGVLGRAVRVRTDGVAEAFSGEPPDATVTIIADGGSPSQRVLRTTARDAPERARALGEGEVILAFGAPDERMQWSQRRPLFGKRVLVTRAREQAASTVALLRDRGADPIVVPTIEIRPPTDVSPLEDALEALRAGAYGWVAFTSANGVDRTWEALSAAGGDARAFGRVRLAAIGPATARALDRRGLRADVVAKEFRGELLAEGMLEAIRLSKGPLSSRPRLPRFPRVLIARAARARDVLPDMLRAGGCRVDVVPVYETHAPPPEVVESLDRELATGRVDAVMFTSSSTVENLCDLLGPRAAERLARSRVASIGPVTSASAEARGLRVDVTAREFTVAGLIEVLVESYAGTAL